MDPVSQARAKSRIGLNTHRPTAVYLVPSQIGEKRVLQLSAVTAMWTSPPPCDGKWGHVTFNEMFRSRGRDPFGSDGTTSHQSRTGRQIYLGPTKCSERSSSGCGRRAATASAAAGWARRNGSSSSTTCSAHQYEAAGDARCSPVGPSQAHLSDDRRERTQAQVRARLEPLHGGIQVSKAGLPGVTVPPPSQGVC
jgi:hypothetical protein